MMASLTFFCRGLCFDDPRQQLLPWAAASTDMLVLSVWATAAVVVMGTTKPGCGRQDETERIRRARAFCGSSSVAGL